MTEQPSSEPSAPLPAGTDEPSPQQPAHTTGESDAAAGDTGTLTQQPVPPSSQQAAPSLTRHIDTAALIDRLDAPLTPWVRGPRSWLLPGAVTLVGAALRWPSLARPNALVFDETYYAKDAWSLLTHGAEWNWAAKVDDAVIRAHGNAAAINALFAPGPEYVAHPPLGKWVIAIGEHLFGMTPFGWRFMPAVLGTLLVLIAARIALRLTRSVAVATLAGLFLAIDGMAIALSRTALLDGILTFFVVAAVACVLIDRDAVRRALAQRLRTSLSPADVIREWQVRGLPRARRPWLWAAGACLGFAVSTKWSALWHLAFIWLCVVAMGAGRHRLLHIPHRWRRTLVSEAAPAVAALVALPALVYVASWAGWFATPGAYFRTWAATGTAVGVAAFVPPALRSWLHYHAQMWDFHVHLTAGHAYKANAWSWLVMGRPTSFYYDSKTPCGARSCSAEVLALGNPIIWWAGLLAVMHQMWQWLAKRDHRAMLIVAGWAAGWVPWLLFQQRTIFTFYAIVMAPFTCLALARALVSILDTKGERNMKFAVVTSVILAAIVMAWFFYPLWTGQSIPYDKWGLRMWLSTWV